MSEVTVRIEDESLVVAARQETLCGALIMALRSYEYAGIQGCPLELMAELVVEFSDDHRWRGLAEVSEQLEVMVHGAELFLAAVSKYRADNKLASQL